MAKSQNFELAFARRIVFRNQRSVSRLVVLLAVISISLGVAVMEVSISIAVGFKSTIKEKVAGFGSHIQVGNLLGDLDSEISPLPAENEFIDQIKAMPEVVSIAPFIMLPAMIKSESTLEGIVIKGVDTTYDWTFFAAGMQAGIIPDYSGKEQSQDILLSQSLADLLDVEVGSKARIYFLGEKPKIRPVTIAGVFSTGIAEFDAVSVICDYRVLQQVLRWDEDEVAGFEVKLTSIDHLDTKSEEIRDLLPPQYDAYPISSIYPEIFDWLDLQDQNVLAILVLMLIIAIINMTSVVLILIIERTQTIGLLKSLGLSNLRVKKIFIYNALFLISAGVIIGNLLAFGIIASQYWLEWAKLDSENYFVAVVPVAWAWGWFALVNLGVILLCTVFMFLPAWTITRISPAQALRFD